jgi:serine/threonine protein phosphatase 1
MTDNKIDAVKHLMKNKKETLHMKKNEWGRDFVVGDIHGCYSELQAILQSIKFNVSRDRLICCGDLTDRGPDSSLVANYVKQSWFYSIMGNHDECILWAFTKKPGFALDRWYSDSVGGYWWSTLSSGEQFEIAFQVAQLPTAIELDSPIGKVGFAHAGIPFQKNWPTHLEKINKKHNETISHTLWDRSHAVVDTPTITGIDYVFIGHTTFAETTIKNNSIFVDTGAGYQHYPNDNALYNPKGRLNVVEINKETLSSFKRK